MGTNEMRGDGAATGGREASVTSTARGPGRSPRVCAAITKAGTPCRVPPLLDSLAEAPRCFIHDNRPKTMAKRLAANRAGGLAAYKTRAKHDLTTLEGQRAFLARVVRDMEARLISQKRGEVLVRALKTMIRIQSRMDAAKPRKIVVELAPWARGPEQPEQATHRDEFESGGNSPPSGVWR